MRVLFSSTRGAGHLQPLLPYARALKARQHEVVVAAPAEVGSTLRSAGLSHATFDHPGDDVLSPIWARLKGEWSEEAMAIAAREIFAGANASAALPKLRETLRSFCPELIVRDSFEFAALVAAERDGISHARVAVHSISFEDPIPALIEQPIDGLRALAGLAPDHGAALREEPVFSSFPASLDIAPAASLMRAPFRARAVEDAPSSAPAAWASADDARPLVYVTFGTLVAGNSQARSIYRTSLEAVAGLPVRVLLTTGRSVDSDVLGTIPANVHVETWVPQRDVLQHAAALVCHGGSGTLLGGVAAGLPMLIVPFGADQPHNAQLIEKAGVGLALHKPDASTLGAALRRVLSAPEFRLHAQGLAREVGAMPTIDDAVDTLLALA